MAYDMFSQNFFPSAGQFFQSMFQAIPTSPIYTRANIPHYNIPHVTPHAAPTGEPNLRHHNYVDLTDFADQQGDGAGAHRIFVDNNLSGHDTGFDAITNFGRDDALVFAAQLPDPNNDGIIDLTHGIVDTGSGAIHLFADITHRSISHLEYDGPTEFGSDLYHVYSRVGSGLHNSDVVIV